MEQDKILEIVDNACAVAGLKVLDGGADFIIIRDCQSDTDYRITVSEELA